MMNKNTTNKIIILVVLLLSLNIFATAHTGEDFTNAKQLIDSKINCDQLSDNQLEIIGDYYMEQMHPGETHELMDQMMGGEGSESLRQVHINMAKRLYCNVDVYIGYGMMGGGMMNLVGFGMMGNYPIYYRYNSFWNILWLVFLIGVIVLIIWLIYNFTKKGKESETPISILQKRYVKGDINKKQFDEMKKELRK